MSKQQVGIMDPPFQRTAGGGSSISRASNITNLTIPEDDTVLGITSTMLTKSHSGATTITPFDTTRSQHSPKNAVFGNKLKRRLSSVRAAAPQYFQTLRPALSFRSISTLDVTNSHLSFDDDLDLEQDWLSDDDSEEDNDQTSSSNNKNNPMNINMTENSALTLYKQDSLQSTATHTDYQTFNPLLLGMTSVSGVGYKNFLRQHTIEDSMTAIHRKKRKRVRKMPTTPNAMQQIISVIPLKAPKPKMGKYGTIFCIVNVYVNNTMLYNPYVCYV